MYEFEHLQKEAYLFSDFNNIKSRQQISLSQRKNKINKKTYGKTYLNSNKLDHCGTHSGYLRLV